MGLTTNSLRDLHHLHRRISSLREQFERGPRQLEVRRKHLAERTELLEKARADLKSIKVQTHQKESERKGLETRINQLQLQINTAKSNKEYSTLVSEKESAAKSRAAVEDHVLELLMREDEKTSQLQTSEKEFKRLQQELAELERKVGDQGAAMAGELTAAETQLRVAEATLPNDMQDAYRRVVSRRGPDALAHAENGTCTGCYTAITPQMQNQLLVNELVLCKSCGRILYLEDTPVIVEAE